LCSIELVPDQQRAPLAPQQDPFLEPILSPDHHRLLIFIHVVEDGVPGIDWQDFCSVQRWFRSHGQ